MKYILASNSPRRKQILAQCGIDFDVVSPDCDETLNTDEFSYPLIENLALKKAQSVRKKINYPAIIIAADTVVVLENKIFGKPENESAAVEMLKKLSAETHTVVTAHCVINNQTDKIKILSDTSYVTFNELSEMQIRNYVKKYKPLDKAGAYGIQEMPEGCLKECKGSLSNVIGLSKNIITDLIGL